MRKQYDAQLSDDQIQKLLRGSQILQNHGGHSSSGFRQSRDRLRNKNISSQEVKSQGNSIDNQRAPPDAKCLNQGDSKGSLQPETVDRLDKKAAAFPDKMSNDGASSDTSLRQSLFKRRAGSFQVIPCLQEAHTSRNSERKPASAEKRNQKSTTDSEEKDRMGVEGTQINPPVPAQAV